MVLSVLKTTLLVVLLGASGCRDTIDRWQLKKLGTESFDASAWKTATNSQRGKMIYSFVHTHNVYEMTRSDIENRLGPATGYYLYDEWPAYQVTSDNRILVAFITDEDTGRISEIYYGSP